MAENYMLVRVLYPYIAQDLKHLTLVQHETIRVIQTHDSGWWIGENMRGDVGLFPANYVSKLTNEKTEESITSKRFNKPKEHKPELANVDFELKKSKTQTMADALGLEVEELGDLDKLDDLNAILSDSEDEDEEMSSITSVPEVIKSESSSQDDRNEVVTRYLREIEALKKERDQALRARENAEFRISSLEERTRELEQNKLVIPLIKDIKSKESAAKTNERLPLSARGSRPSEVDPRAQKKLEDTTKQLLEYKSLYEKVVAENEKNKKMISDLNVTYNQNLKAANDRYKSLEQENKKTGSLGSETRNSLLRNKKSIQAIRDDQKALKKEATDSIKTIRSLMNSLAQNGITPLIGMVEEVTARYRKECKVRRELFNQLQELKGNIRVYVRIRPILPSDVTVGSCVTCDEAEVTVNDANAKKIHKFEFERAFGPGTTQTEIFDDVQPLATSILDGYNVCIFAYGQTGSGKTHTMEGNASDRGVNYRTLDELFKIINERQGDYTYSICVAVMEIHNETLLDLLSKDKQPLDIKMAGQVSVPNLTTVPVTSSPQVFEVLSKGYKNRAVGANNINIHSSRSHCIVSVFVEGTNHISRQKIIGKLHMIDLAGSERLKRTETTGDRLKESLAINKSLSALGDVVSALASKKPHVPYRNSKLTSLLQDSLGGNSKTLMFVNVSPTIESAPETICSLQFATRVSKVELGKAERNISSV